MKKGKPHIYFQAGYWWYQNSEGPRFAFMTVYSIQRLYHGYEPNRYYKGLGKRHSRHY